MTYSRLTAGVLVCALACAFVLAVAPDAHAAVGSVLLDAHSHLMPYVASAAALAVDPAEIKKSIDSMMTAFEEFKTANDARLKEVEKKGAADPVLTDKLAKIESDLAKFEDINQKLTRAELDAKAAKARDEELKGELEKVQLRLNRPGAAGNDKAEKKAYHSNWLRGVFAGLAGGQVSEEGRKAIERSNTEAKSLSIGNDTTGGYLAPGEYVMEIIKGVTEISPVRSLVRVRQTAGKSVMLPKRTGQFAAVWVAEQGSRTETQGLKWGLEEIHSHEMYALIDISHQNLEDSAFDLEAEVRGESEEQFAVAEGAAVVSGSGVGKPQGFLFNAGTADFVQATASGTAATIADADGQANGLISAYHAIKTAYARNGTWALNRTTLGSVRKLKDANKQYIWQPGIAGLRPSTILDAPYVEVPDMPDEGANAFPIVFGDFRRAYTMVDRISMSMLRDPYTQAGSGNIRFLFYRRVGGQLVLAEALRAVKCST